MFRDCGSRFKILPCYRIRSGCCDRVTIVRDYFIKWNCSLDIITSRSSFYWNRNVITLFTYAKIDVFFFTSFPGEFPFAPVYCLAWICLDVLFCTASIMHLCTISVDRYLSLRYPMKFGRNKTRRRVILKIVFVWLLSIAMSLPLSLMYSKVSRREHNK